MLAANNEVWVTSALSDASVSKALLLCYSLRKAFTTRRIAVIASMKISSGLKKSLSHGFDFVFYLQEDLNTPKMKLDEFAKLFSFSALNAFTKGAFVSPQMMALKNCDDIFEQATELVTLLENNDTSVFLFKPSPKLFEIFLEEFEFKNGTTNIGEYLQLWMKNQKMENRYLNRKFNKICGIGEPLLGLEEDFSLVNFTNYPNKLTIGELGNIGFAHKCLAGRWLQIMKESVEPIIGHYRNALSSGTVPSVAKNPGISYDMEPIAVVGMSCRYPNSNNLEEFWDLLFQSQDGTSTPPSFRWLRDQSARQLAGSRNTNAGFLKAPLDEFDAKFFGISPKEVVFMDPQHRLLHELVWEGLEDACIDPLSLRGSNGSVFMGSWLNDYKDILTFSGSSEFYRVYMGTSIGAAAARISFLLGMTGPSISTESGCSSAMVAVHLACKSLQLGETNLALACGVNVLLHPFDKDELPMVISPDGHCKTFSSDANGFARAEGAGVLVLKRFTDAMKDGDHIWGVIRGSAVSQEGVSKSMGTPTVHSEALAMQGALKDARISHLDVDMVECHGTGTSVGDPMEVQAIEKVYGKGRKEPLYIGSVKTNVGHTESCSGITGIMKVILAMKHETIPAHINFTSLNPVINLEAVPAIIPLETTQWKKKSGKPRIAGVSSFGITGTDCHVIVEEPPLIATTSVRSALVVNDEMERPLHILKLSTKTDEAMNKLLEKYKNTLETIDEPITDICYSANTGRADFSVRVAIVAKNKQEILCSIEKETYMREESSPENHGKICFLFTGQGSQYPGLAKTLCETSPVFRMHFTHCEKILREMYNINITNVLWPSNPTGNSEISRTIYSQTSIFCVEYALLKLWESLGVKPDYVLGHSLGEMAAAFSAGILSLEDALKLVAERSRLIDQLERGKMLVIKADKQQVDNLMAKYAKGNQKKFLDYAAINSSEQTVVAGDTDVVEEFSIFCQQNQTKCLILEATHAFHSRHMDPMLENYKNVAMTIPVSAQSRCGYISGVLGEVIPSSEVSVDYWVKHTREPVRFLAASQKAIELGCKIFIEIGPQPVLCSLMSMNTNEKLLCLPSLKRNEAEWTTFLTSLARLYTNGGNIHWKGLDQFYNRRKVRLPHYPFIGKKFWPNVMQVTGHSIHPLLGSAIPNASSTKIYQCGVNLRSHEYIKDHAIGETVIFPGAGYLECCLAAGLASVEDSNDNLGKPTRPMKIQNLQIHAPLALDESKTCNLQTVVQFNTNENEQDWNAISVKIYNRQDSEISTSWLLHASATFSPMPAAEEQIVYFDQAEFKQTIVLPHDDEIVTQVYKKLLTVGLKFGPVFKSLEKVWRNQEKGTLLAKVKVPQPSDDQISRYIVHPAVLDSMIQAIMMNKLSDSIRKKLYVPLKIDKFTWISDSKNNSPERFVYVEESSTSTENQDPFTNNLSAFLLDSDGEVLAVMSGVEFIDTTVKALESVLEHQVCTMPELWEEIWPQKDGPMKYLHDSGKCSKDPFYTQQFCEEMIEKYNKPPPQILGVFQRLEKFAYYNLLRGLYQCGFKPQVNCIYRLLDLLKELNIKEEHTKMLAYIFRVFEEETITEKVDSDVWKIIRSPPSLTEIETELCSPLFTSDLQNQFESTSLLAKLGENICNILQGNESALSILFPEEGKNKKWPSVSEFYTHYGEWSRLSEMMDIIGKTITQHCKAVAEDERFVLRVLEIGAGTGAATSYCLEHMSELGIEFEYTFTDISPAFFSGAERKFEKYSKNLIFKKLDIEEDPICQGFKPGYYDKIYASDVIHTTKNLTETFNNIRLLMKPGGSFNMIEMTRVNRVITYLFGFLDGFWRFQDSNIRPDHCTLSTEKWRESLEASGLSWVHSFPVFEDRHSWISAKRKLETGQESPIKLVTPKQPVWIIFQETTNKVSNYLVKMIPLLTNRKVILVNSGASYIHGETSNEFTIRGSKELDYIKMIKSIQSLHDTEIEGILYAWPLNRNIVDQASVLGPAFFIAKAILSLKNISKIRYIALLNETTGIEDNELSNPFPSTIVGFLKTMMNESDIRPYCIDIGGNETEGGMLQVFYEIWNDEKIVPHVVFQEYNRSQPKLKALKQQLVDLKLPEGTERYQLILPETRAIQDLQFGHLDPFVLGDKEIEIQVKASALNFRDVLSVLKPSEKFKDLNAVGMDFGGLVKRVGLSVTKWRVGDRVFGVNFYNIALPSHITLNENDVLPIPENMTFCEASTLPAVVATSYHCLIDVAKISPTDVVLIHTGTGGVGLSSIELCKYVGATVIATAGSKRKRKYLRNLGIKHVFHSRNTAYCEEIHRVTNGRGVDVVLNTLTGEGFKEATLKACAHGARFIEISKLSVWTPDEVKQLRPDVRYSIEDVSSMDTASFRYLMSNLEKLSKSNVIHPIPYVRFDGTHIREALQYMQKAKHIGKIVCVLPEVRRVDGKSQIFTPLFHDNATYIVSGGNKYSNIGFAVGEWMVKKGAKYVILAGRNPADSATRQRISSINAEFDAKIVSIQLDVSDFEQCKRLTQSKIPELGYPTLRGVMHAAGTLRDGLIANHTWESFSSTLTAKVTGTHNLHELTKDSSNLEHFVLFSSIASILGSPGQSNHASGNTFEDVMAHYRNSLGLPATSINWGQWGQAGVATDADIPGVKPFSTLQGLNALEYTLKSQRTQLAAFNISSFPLLGKLCTFASLYIDERKWQTQSLPGGASLKSDEFWALYDAACSFEEKLTILKDKLRYIIRFILKLEESEEIGDNADFQNLGLDSLMYVEMKNSVQSLFGDRVAINASTLRDCNTLQLLANTLVSTIEGGIEEEDSVPTLEEVNALIKEDVELPEHIRPRPEQKRVNIQEISTVLLTGCTGTLGPYILRELCKVPQVKQIVCLIRPKGNLTGEQRLKKLLEERELNQEIDMDKVRCVSGNVAHVNLGLEPEVLLELCNSVEAIFHCAAFVQHMEHYKKRKTDRDMRAVNVGGTKHILEFACSGEILKHVFTASSLLAVATADAFGCLSENWQGDDDYLGLTTFAYPITKFIGDALMRKAVTERGIPGKVFRFPFITGDSQSGRFILDQNHFMLRYFFILKCGVMPSNPFPMPAVPVDHCSMVAVKVALNPKAENDVYNVCSATPSLDQEFVTVAKKLGYKIDIVEFSEFSEKIRESTSDDSPYAIFKDFYSSDEHLMSVYTSSPAMREWMLDPSVNEGFTVSRKLIKYIPEFYHSPRSTMDSLYNDLLFAKKQGWLEKFAK